MLISVDSAADTSKAASDITGLARVTSVCEITGQYDIATTIQAPNITEISACIDALRKVSGVIDANTVIMLGKLP